MKSYFDEIDVTTIKKAAKVIRSINHPIRQQVISLIAESGQITVTEIYKKIEVTNRKNKNLVQSETSSLLGILRKENLVITKREGKFVYYTLNTERINKITNLCYELVSQSDKL